MTNRNHICAFNWYQNRWPWITLNCYKFTFSRNLCASSHFWEETMAKRMKIDPNCQRQKCSPMILVSGNIRRMRIYAYAYIRRRQITVELSTTAFFGDLCGYFFENVRDKTSNITWRHATPCRPIIDSKVNDIEWPWVPISCQNPFPPARLSRAYLCVS